MDYEIVKANGDPTRTRDRNGRFMQSQTGKLKIDSAHRFVKQSGSTDSFQRDRYVQSISKRVDALSPATQRVLTAVRKAMLISFDPVSGYTFRQHVNRATIADQLGRTTLVPYDIRMLRHLCDLRLVQERKRALPRKKYGDIWLGAGAEFIYTIDNDVLYCLLHHDPRERSRLLALQPAKTRAGVSRKPLSDREFDTLLKALPGTQKRTLWARVRDLLDL